MTSKNYRAPLFTLHQALCIISNPSAVSNWSYCPEALNLVKISDFFVPCDLEIWGMNLKNNRAPLLCRFKLYVSFLGHRWIKNLSYSPETLNSGQNGRFLVLCDPEIWRMTLKNNRAPLLSINKLCASFHHHMCIQTGVTVRKRLSWVMTSVTLTLDLDLLHGDHFCHW